MRGHGQAVELQLGDVLEFGAAQQLAHAAVEIAQLAFVQGVVETEHGRAVRHLDETLARFAAYALGWASRASSSSGWRGLQIAQFAHEGVVFGVADFGLVEHVVQALVMAQRFAQLFDPGGSIFRHRRDYYSLMRTSGGQGAWLV